MSIDKALKLIRDSYFQSLDTNLLSDACNDAMRRLSAETSLELRDVSLEGANPQMREIAAHLAAVSRADPASRPPAKVVAACMVGVLGLLDSRSEYLDVEQFKEIKAGSGLLGGIGLELALASNRLRVVYSIEGGPARRAGITGGDVITHIDDVATGGLPLAKSVALLRGAPGSPVRITLERPGMNEPMTLDLIRRIIQIQSVEWNRRSPEIVHIKIKDLREYAAAGVVDALLGAYARDDTHPRGLILDLRDNTGGLFNASIEVSTIFLRKHVVVATLKARNPEFGGTYSASIDLYGRNRYLEKVPAAVKSVPIVVLVNRRTAAGAEIIAAALRDHRRARILGERTSGMGTVQTILPLGNDTALKLTSAMVLSPDGKSFHGTGLTPDVEIDLISPSAAQRDIGVEEAIRVLGQMR